MKKILTIIIAVVLVAALAAPALARNKGYSPNHRQAPQHHRWTPFPIPFPIPIPIPVPIPRPYPYPNPYPYPDPQPNPPNGGYHSGHWETQWEWDYYSQRWHQIRVWVEDYPYYKR